MSEQHEGGEAAEDFDLSEVPMDGADGADASGGDEHDDDDGGEGDEDEAKEEDKPAKAPLSQEELEKRYSSTKVALAKERALRREAERRADQRAEHREEPAPRKVAQQQDDVEEAIDPDVDPLGYMKQMGKKIAAYEQAERLDQQTEAQRAARERQFAQVEAQLSEHETDFKDDHPDYDDAAKHYAITRAKELMGFGFKPEKVQVMLREEFATLAATAMQARKNPAAVVYEMAKGRGFGSKAAKDDKDPKAKDKGAGKIEALRRGAASSSPLGRSGGRSSGGLDAATVANINIRDPKGGEAFDKAFEALERQARRAERA